MLADYLDGDLRVMAIGINPSLLSARLGFPFAHPQNRFWPALNASRLVSVPLTPGIEAMSTLSGVYRIGFTDIVKRPSAGARDLRVVDYAAGAPRLAKKIAAVKPEVLWFLGKTAAAAFCRYQCPGQRNLGWGLQTFKYKHAQCFISPSPSAANARWSLTMLVASFNELADILAPGE